MSRLSKKHFWEWFTRNQETYLVLDKQPKKETQYWLNELNAHLRAYNRHFGYSLSVDGKGGGRLTLTVGGREQYFKQIDAFVATAPVIEGWVFSSLEEPRAIDFLLEKEMEQVGVDVHEFSFSIEEDGDGGVNITGYHSLYTIHNRKRYQQLFQAAVYNLLGERVLGEEVGEVEVANSSRAEGITVYALEELPQVMGERRSGMVVDENGVIVIL